MSSKLRKSVRVYQRLVAKLPPLSDAYVEARRDNFRAAYREIGSYLRSLYHEFGRTNVRATIKEMAR